MRSSAARPTGSGGGYDGPLAYRMGKGMRPDVAAAFDRMAAAARRDGLALSITSAFRSDAEQARLFAANPNPKWVAPPGTSLHRYATELDLGPPAAYAWLAANARAFGFIHRYAWEPWHYGFGPNPRDREHPAQYERGSWEPPGGDHSRIAHRLPAFVPQRFHDPIAAAALRWNVPMELLAAQLYAESGFNPFAVSAAGARGIAQFMPGTAREYGLTDPHDPVASIDAQAHLMSDLLRRFGGKVALALAAYNAGAGAVDRYGGIPPYPETRAYVARILGLLGGAGALAGGSRLGGEARGVIGRFSVWRERHFRAYLGTSAYGLRGRRRDPLGTHPRLPALRSTNGVPHGGQPAGPRGPMRAFSPLVHSPGWRLRPCPAWVPAAPCTSEHRYS